MAGRKAHHKSKLGCADCRRRRIKCDECRPSCRNCNKRGLVCSFRTFDPAKPSFTPSDSHFASPHSINATSTASDSTSTSLFLDAVDSYDLLRGTSSEQRTQSQHLLSHFSSVTSATLASNQLGQNTWLSAIPRLASTHSYVLQGVLAVTALHLSLCCEGTATKQEYLTLAVDQMSKGLAGYRIDIEHVNESNAEALFTFSSLMSSYTLATANEECKALLITTDFSSHGQKSSRRLEMTNITTRVLRAVRGVLVILVPCWHHLQQGVLSPITNRDWWPTGLPLTTEAIEEGRQIQALEKLWMRPDRSYEYCFDTLASSLRHLRECFALMSQLAVNPKTAGDSPSHHFLLDWCAVMVWPTRISHDFSTLLEQQLPEAWVILAHYAMLPHRARGIWWLEGWSAHLVTAAALVLGEDKWDKIEWPARVVGVDLQTLNIPPSTTSNP